MRLLLFLMLMLAPTLTAPAMAQAPTDTMVQAFSDPALEVRARHLQRQLRCLVCQGESVDESASPFSADIRRLVRAQIAQGKSDRQIQDYLVARYGDFILMKPPLQPDTWLLWLAPFAVLVIAGLVAAVTVKKAAAREA